MIDASGHAPTLESLSRFPLAARVARQPSSFPIPAQAIVPSLLRTNIQSLDFGYEPIQAAQQHVRPFHCDRIR